MTENSATRSETKADSALAPLRNSTFRAVWIASLLSNFGGMIQSVGASWTMVAIAGSAQLVALVQSSVALPIMLLSLVAGAVADSLDRRRIMIAAQCFMLLVSVALALGAWLGLITPWLLLLFTFLIGCGTAFNGPAWQASVGDMVERRDLPSAVALNSMGFNIARSLGPAIGGAIVAAFGAALAFALNALSYIALILVLLRWSPPRPDGPLPRETIPRAIAAGVRYVSMSPSIRVVLGRALVFGIAASAIPSLMPLVARDLIAGGPLTYGLLLGAFGMGAIGGAIASARLRRSCSSEMLVSGACLSMAAASLFTGLSNVLPLTMALLFVAGGSWVLALSTFNVSVQLHAPRWVVARALSLYQMSAFGGMALGSWAWGFAVHERSIPFALAGAAGVHLLCALLGLRLRIPDIDQPDLTPLGRWQIPEIAVPVEGRTGPVVITIEYRISPDDCAEFLTAMADRRRVRRRDGARHWSLLRDLADPEIWIERFHLPTWNDYVRFNSRVTQEDVAVLDRVRALHRGEHPPRVRRMLERHTNAEIVRREIDPGLSQPLPDPAEQG